jgi:hypothetical protein
LTYLLFFDSSSSGAQEKIKKASREDPPPSGAFIRASSETQFSRLPPIGVRFTKSSGPEWRLIILGKPQKIKEILQLSQVDGFIDVKGRFMDRPYDALSMSRISSKHPSSNLFGSRCTPLAG